QTPSPFLPTNRGEHNDRVSPRIRRRHPQVLDRLHHLRRQLQLLDELGQFFDLVVDLLGVIHGVASLRERGGHDSHLRHVTTAAVLPTRCAPPTINTNPTAVIGHRRTGHGSATTSPRHSSRRTRTAPHRWPVPHRTTTGRSSQHLDPALRLVHRRP